MTTEIQVMAILERANPVPPGELVDVPVGANDYLETALEQRSESMTIVDPTPTNPSDGPPPRRWPLIAIAASIVAILVAAIALIVATRDDDVVVDRPEPTVPPTTAPVATTAVATDTESAQAVVDELFAVHNAGATDDLLSLLADDVRWTEGFGGLAPDPEEVVVPRDEIELDLAWDHAQGETWTGQRCVVADEQRAAGTTLSCGWETRDAVIHAVDGASIPTKALIVVSEGEIAELHILYGAPDFAALGRDFNGWLALYHPAVEGADCCGGETREDAVENGRLRAQWASEWAMWLETWGCAIGELCSLEVEEWAAEYSRQCSSLSPTDPLDDLVAHITSIPRTFGSAAANRLFESDQALIDRETSDERIAELHQQRLDAMVELGIDERCHPIIG